MLRFGKHFLTKSAVLASAVIVALSQQIDAATPSTGFQKAQAVIKTSPRSYEEYSLRADAYRELGQYQKQIDDLTSAIKINPTLADLYERRADAYYQLGQLQNAIDDFTTATSLNPASSDANWPAAASYEELGLYDKALESRTRILRLDTKILRNFRPYCNVKLDGKADVIALLDTGSTFNVSADSLLKPVLDKKLAFNQHIWGPWLGNLRTKSVRLMSVKFGASNVESPIFQVFPADEAPAAAKEITLGNLFLSRFKTVTFDYPARQIILESSDTGSESAANLYGEGQFYVVNNEMRQAVDAFSKSMILDNEFAPVCYQCRSRAFAKLEQYQKALEDITAAIKLDPKSVSNYRIRAWVYAKLGQYRLQIADDTTAIRLAPKDQFAYINRAWAYDRLGKRQLAKRDRRMATECSR